jgi:hypothetical protein
MSSFLFAINVDVEDHAVVLADALNVAQSAWESEGGERKDVHAMVMVEMTWQFKNLRKLRTEMRTVNS